MAKRSLTAELVDIGKGIGRVILFFYLPVVTALVAIHFPYDIDRSLYPSAAKSVQASTTGEAPATKSKRSVSFYETAYNKTPVAKGVNYETTAQLTADANGISAKVKAFVAANGLQDKKILEVGSGRGYLQDMVEDYTGLDISPSAKQNYHKKFVVGSATAIPFPDNTFDAIWTIWVLEHIPEPEKALREMRRVLKPGGKLLLHVAWGCEPWYADGFDVRPYEDFNWKGKMVKASLAVRNNTWYQTAYLLPIRLVRLAQYEVSGKNMPLHFKALEPNYDVYWRPDSDAAVGIDPYEAYLWHRAQGDTCTSCQEQWTQMVEAGDSLTITVNK